MNSIELGLRIKQCRKNQKFTQEKLAEMVDVSPHYIYEIEKGMKTMSLSTFIDISSSLNTSTDYLLFGETTHISASDMNTDQLNTILKGISPKRREGIAEILTVMLPYLK